MRLTEQIIERATLPSDKRELLLRDDAVKGLLVVVGKASKTYAVQTEHWSNGARRTIRRTIGPVASIPLKSARLEAATLVQSIKAGNMTPSEPDTSKEVTFADAWQAYRDACARRGRSERTIGEYEGCLRRVADWFERPVASITKADCRERHSLIEREASTVRADGVFRVVRAVINYAIRKLDVDVRNAVVAVDFSVAPRKQDAMTVDQIPDFHRHRRLLPCPVRQELYLFLLLSGGRLSATLNAKWSGLDRTRRILTFDASTMKAKRRFDLPLSDAMLACLDRLAALPVQSEFIFTRDGQRPISARADDLPYGPHDLRRTYRTTAAALGIDETTCRILMAHASVGVNEGYVARSALLPALLEAQERISAALMRGA